MPENIIIIKGANMRCRACNVILTNEEAVFKDDDGEYPQLCNICLEDVNRDWDNDETQEWVEYDENESYSQAD
jgi:hypothetical protein